MTKQVIKLDNDNMKINRRIMALCLSLSVLFAFLPIIATFAENETISNQQVLQIRNTGEVNMFDVENVKRLAYYYNCYDLIDYLTTDRAGYVNLILTGKFN